MFETFEHTADLGLRVRSDSLESLFADAARGLTSLIVADVGDVTPAEQRRLKVEADELAWLYFDWLTELLYLFESEDWLTASADVSVVGNSVDATLHGTQFEENVHARSHEVKAITYHALRVESPEESGSGSWLAEVIVDI